MEHCGRTNQFQSAGQLNVSRLLIRLSRRGVQGVAEVADLPGTNEPNQLVVIGHVRAVVLEDHVARSRRLRFLGRTAGEENCGSTKT